jgi:hypothetical protein
MQPDRRRIESIDSTPIARDFFSAAPTNAANNKLNVTRPACRENGFAPAHRI